VNLFLKSCHFFVAISQFKEDQALLAFLQKDVNSANLVVNKLSDFDMFFWQQIPFLKE